MTFICIVFHPGHLVVVGVGLPIHGLLAWPLLPVGLGGHCASRSLVVVLATPLGLGLVAGYFPGGSFLGWCSWGVPHVPLVGSLRGAPS